MPKTERKQARATVRLPADLYREARILALERGVTFQMLVESLLSKELDKSDVRRSQRSDRPRKLMKASDDVNPLPLQKDRGGGTEGD